jgi:type III secretion system SsaH family protein
MNASHPIARTIVEAGFTAVNHGLRAEMHDILAALPDWLDDADQLARCEALLLFGLGRHSAAAAKLAGLPDDDCAPLRALLKSSSKESES